MTEAPNAQVFYVSESRRWLSFCVFLWSGVSSLIWLALILVKSWNEGGAIPVDTIMRGAIIGFFGTGCIFLSLRGLTVGRIVVTEEEITIPEDYFDLWKTPKSISFSEIDRFVVGQTCIRRKYASRWIKSFVFRTKEDRGRLPIESKILVGLYDDELAQLIVKRIGRPPEALETTVLSTLKFKQLPES